VKRTVSIRNNHPRLRVPRATVRRAVGLLDASAGRFLGGCPPGELSLVFLTDPALAQIHAQFMGDPSATDVITFEGGASQANTAPAEGAAGEICMSADMAARYVSSKAAPAGRAGLAEELTLYLVHGWLHLAGYDDRNPIKKRRMRAAERRALRLLRQANAVPAFRLA
jgi:probable rRNA maturation factor